MDYPAKQVRNQLQSSLFEWELSNQPAITYSKLTIETLEQGVKYVQVNIEGTMISKVFLAIFQHNEYNG